jgi:ADP-heptose:LPS heptosyltransferase
MVKTPSVGIFGPTSPNRNGSLLKDSISIYKKLPCSFCYKKKCDTIECLKQLDIEEIVNAVNIIHEKCN